MPNITYQTLLDAVNNVSQFRALIPGAVAAPNNAVPTAGMVQLIIAVGEALRFDSVANGIDSVLGNFMSFGAPTAQIRAWGGHTLGS